MTHPIRYARLGYAKLHVSDLAASLTYYRDIVGLSEGGGADGEVWLRCSDKPYELILEQGAEPGLAAIGFEVESAAELDRAFAHVAACGYAPAWTSSDAAPAQQVIAAFRFRNPDTGLMLDYYCGQHVAAPFEASVADIVRMGHVVMNVASYAKAHKFWVEDLGFEISDHVPGRIAFLRCWPNPLHHSLALLEGPEDGLNHLNFMVTDIDDIGRATNRLKKADVPIVFGPGRHLPSTSIFLYFLDPDGMTTEYSFGMELFDEEDARPPRALEPKPEVLDTWGSIADPRFGKTGRILRADG
ncbi:VOC family protein [Sphingopyxis sp.]|uniref:VOC family protein n=1 Tax=Sphingopyxis sp. TaxID=1908224 RepID=UPI003D0C0D70